MHSREVRRKVDWKKLIASLVWVGGIGALDIAYIFGHGLDPTAIVTGMFALAPAWAYIGKDVSLSFFGQKLEIKGSDIASATAEVARAAPAAIEQVRKLPELPVPAEPTTEWPKGLPPYRLSIFGAEDVEHANLSRVITIDPNLALVSLRIEIEHRVNAIAGLVDLKPQRSLTQTVQALTKLEVFTPELADGLERLIRYGNAAAHGATIVEAQPVRVTEVLETLDAIISQLKKRR